LMLRVASLIVESKNVAGFITCELVVRSIFETTNTVMRHQVNQKALLLQLYLRLTIIIFASKINAKQKGA
jgi:hypothetical protein